MIPRLGANHAACGSDPCVYTTNHTIPAYSADLEEWHLEGVALGPSDRLNGTVFVLMSSIGGRGSL